MLSKWYNVQNIKSLQSFSSKFALIEKLDQSKSGVIFNNIFKYSFETFISLTTCLKNLTFELEVMIFLKLHEVFSSH